MQSCIIHFIYEHNPFRWHATSVANIEKYMRCHVSRLDTNTKSIQLMGDEEFSAPSVQRYTVIHRHIHKGAFILLSLSIWQPLSQLIPLPSIQTYTAHRHTHASRTTTKPKSCFGDRHERVSGHPSALFTLIVRIVYAIASSFND